MAPDSSSAEEERKKKHRLCEQRRKAKIKMDPQKREEFLRKDRERYLRRKAAGLIPLIHEMTPEKLEILRKRNRANALAYYRRNKANTSKKMAPDTSSAEEERKKRHSLCEQRRKAKIKMDPQKREEFLRKDRERYLKRKAAGLIPLRHQMSPEKLEMIRKRKRAKAREYYRRKKAKKYQEMEWTNEQVEQLIATYQQLPALWDPMTHKRGLGDKYVAWKNLAAAFQCDLADLKKKMQSVLASYRREKSKVRGGNRSYWFLYDRLSFLPNYIPNIQGPANTPSKRKTYNSSSDEADDDFDHETEPEVEIKMEPPDVLVNFYDEPTKIHTKRRLTRNPIKSPPRLVEVSLRSEVSRDSEVRREPEVSREPELRREPEVRREPEFRPVPEVRREPEFTPVPEVRREPVVRREPEFRREGEVRRIEKDECDSFGEYIAMSLRKHDERTRATMKQAINNIIFELEMKKYSNNTYTDVPEVNPLNG